MEVYPQTDLQDVIPNARIARVRNLLSRIAIPTRERLRFSLCISNTRAHSFLWCHSEGAHSAGEEPAFSRIRAVRSVDDREAIISKESEHPYRAPKRASLPVQSFSVLTPNSKPTRNSFRGSTPLPRGDKVFQKIPTGTSNFQLDFPLFGGS
jgi:hypothetical protein